MKIDFTKPLMTIKGVPLKATPDENAADLTLQDVAITGLFAPLPADQGSPAKAAEAFKLALRISNSLKGCEISAEESILIKTGIGRAYGNQPQVCGPVELLLEGEAIVKEAE